MKIAVSGYYGFGNTGDEAILLAIKEGFKDHTLFVLGKDDRFNFSYIRNSDVLISGGGGLLQDSTSAKSFLYYAGIILLAKFLRKKVYIFAQSIGPVANPANKYLLRKVLNASDLITVRDKASFEYLESLNLNHKNMIQTADPTFILKPEYTVKIAKRNEVPTIGICPREILAANRLPEEFAAICDKLYKNLKANILLIPFQPLKDAGICSKIKALSKAPIEILSNSNPLEIMGMIAQMDLIIGMRLHSLIFAANTNVPAIGISYDPKVDGFMEGVGLPVLTIKDLSNAHKASSLAKQMLDNSSGVKHSLEIERSKLYANARLNFELVRKV